MCITSPASTISSMKVCARPISPAMARVPRAGWYSFDDHGVHFIGLVNVVDLKAGGLGRLEHEHVAWLGDDIKDKSNSTPMSCSRTSRSGRSMPIGDGAPTNGLRALRSAHAHGYGRNDGDLGQYPSCGFRKEWDIPLERARHRRELHA